MTRADNLTSNKKDKLFPIKLREQDKKCILCKMPFEKTIVWNESCCFDHLNDKRDVNVDTNLAIVHKECNLIKRYNIDYKIRADEWRLHLESQITDSEREKKIISEGVSERENECESYEQPYTATQTDEDTEDLTEGQINLIVNQIALAQLEEFLPENSKKQIDYQKTLANVHYLLIQRTGGRGSEPAARRALDNLVKSEYSQWESRKLSKGNRIIQRRMQS